ncbi:MAG: response regulator [Deltaproteobacteria bacterium]|nr:response regulator [Deltaproteobacteria bacterium]
MTRAEGDLISSMASTILQSETIAAPFGCHRVLVIEDDSDLRALVAQVLRDEQFEVFEAENGRTGVDLALSSRPDIILCDVEMPELGGLSAFQAIRSDPALSRVPFVFVSGVDTSAQDIRRAMNLGADDYLVKPFTPDDLRQTVHARLRRHVLDATSPDLGSMTLGPSAEALLALESSVRILRRAARGGMGTVYEGVDLTDGSRVAVKAAPFHDEMREARLLRESEALAALHIPEIIALRRTVITADRTLFLVMDWFDGEDLGARLKRGTLELPEVLAVGRRVATALAAAHALGILHRDVKPTNIFLRDGRADRAVLIDFGLARLPEAAPLTLLGGIIGTPGYLSPEQLNGVSEISSRVDVFALGCTLFEALTGRGPFAGENAMASLANVLMRVAPLASSVRPETPAPLDALVAEMLSRDPAQRPSDGAAVMERLRAIGA